MMAKTQDNKSYNPFVSPLVAKPSMVALGELECVMYLCCIFGFGCPFFAGKVDKEGFQTPLKKKGPEVFIGITSSLELPSKWC